MIIKSSSNLVSTLFTSKGPFKCYIMQVGVGVGGVAFSGKKDLRRCKVQRY